MDLPFQFPHAPEKPKFRSLYLRVDSRPSILL